MRADLPDRGRRLDHRARLPRRPSRRSRGVPAAAGGADTYMDVPMRLRRYRSDVFTDKYKRLNWDAPCRSITAHIAKDGYWYIHPDQHRTLSIREAARVQTFPGRLPLRRHTRRTATARSATPFRSLLGEAVGHAVMRTLQRPRRARPIRADRGVRDTLIAWHATDEPWTAPWRRTGDPWQVLIGELALARARPRDADRIHHALLDLAPTPAALARARRAHRATRRDRSEGTGGTLVAIADDLVDPLRRHCPGRRVRPRAAPRRRRLRLPGGAHLRVRSPAGARRPHDRPDRVATDRTRRRARASRCGWICIGLAGAEGPDAAFNRRCSTSDARSAWPTTRAAALSAAGRLRTARADARPRTAADQRRADHMRSPHEPTGSSPCCPRPDG